jgi:hypothetical protein
MRSNEFEQNQDAQTNLLELWTNVDMIRNQTLYNGRSSTFSLKVIVNILRVLVLRVLVRTSTPSNAGNCQITFLKPTISHLLKHEIKGQASTQLFLITIVLKVISSSPLVPFNRPKNASRHALVLLIMAGRFLHNRQQEDLVSQNKAYIYNWQDPS